MVAQALWVSRRRARKKLEGGEVIVVETSYKKYSKKVYLIKNDMVSVLLG